MSDIKELVSIITPLYNCEKFLEETIDCVLKQTYSNWEWILVDDCSTDNSAEIIKKYAKEDKRIKYVKLEENSGAAVARNKAIDMSTGRFIAFLDADDLWRPNKTEFQVNYMLKNHYGFTCTDYDKVDEEGNSLNKIIRLPEKINYDQLLGNTIIQTVGVMIDLEIIDKKLVNMPLMRKRQDSATWAKILKPGNLCYRVPQVLATYRVVKGSLSSNKLTLIKHNWHWWRDVEHLGLFKTCLCTISWAFNATKKRIYFKRRK